MTDVTKLIDELDALRAKATQGEWGEGDGCCGPYLDYQAHDDERVGPFPTSDYDGREPIWLGGSVLPEDRRWIAAIVNAYPALRDAIRERDAIIANREWVPF